MPYADKARAKEYQAEYRARNKERRREKQAEYYALNKVQLKEKQAEYNALNKARINENKARYYTLNKARIKEKSATYYALNKAQKKEYAAEYYRASPVQQLKLRISARLRNLKRSGQINVDVGKVENYIGCTWEQMLEHLGGVLPPGYELDHIIPLSKYDLNNPEELHSAFNYRNTQLLWSPVHRKKGTKLPDESVLLQLQDLWPAEWKVGM